MSLDTVTLYLVATMVAAMLGAMLLFFGKQENIPALKWWGTAYLLGAASIALWTFAGNAFGEMFSLALSALGFVACGMVWNVPTCRDSSWVRSPGPLRLRRWRRRPPQCV